MTAYEHMMQRLRGGLVGNGWAIDDDREPDGVGRGVRGPGDGLGGGPRRWTVFRSIR